MAPVHFQDAHDMIFNFGIIFNPEILLSEYISVIGHEDIDK